MTDEQNNERPLLFGDKRDRYQNQTAVLSRNNAGLRRVINNQASTSHPNGTATLGDQREVILVIRGMIERLMVSEDSRYKLGRFDLGTKGFDEVDLTPYGAVDRGVSRVHAQLHLEGDHMFITDLGSTNGTYLAGRRLEPQVPTLLRKGDELLLGRLPIQIMFR